MSSMDTRDSLRRLGTVAFGYEKRIDAISRGTSPIEARVRWSLVPEVYRNVHRDQQVRRGSGRAAAMKIWLDRTGFVP